MKITLEKPILQSHFNDNGLNTLKDIEAVYLKDININLVRADYHFFRSSFVKASLDFVSKNPVKDTTQGDAKIEPQQIAFLLFNGNEEIIDRANTLIKKVCFKDYAFQNKFDDNDLNNLSYNDWEAIICNFLQCFWLNQWLTGAKAK